MHMHLDKWDHDDNVYQELNILFREKWERGSTHKRAENENNVEEGDGGNKEKSWQGFSWLAEGVQVEQQHQLTCTCRSKPVAQAPATEPN